jgi:hypothetical protein
MAEKLYEIAEVQDVSRLRCKRFVAHVVVFTKDKQELSEIIQEVTKEIKVNNEDYCLPLTLKKFGDSPAHAVRLYLHYEKINNLIGQSMWLDYDAKDIILPKPLVYNDEIEDIGVAWFNLEGIVW